MSVAKRLKGDLFCSVEHSELRHQQLSQTAFERVMSLHGLPDAGPTASDGSAPTQPQSLIRLWVFVVAGAIAIGVLGLLLFNPTRSHGRSPATISNRTAPAVSAVSPLPAVPASISRKSKVSIQASGPSWVVACVDGTVSFAKLFTAGQKSEFDFSRMAIVRSGNPLATHIAINGKKVEMPAAAGGIGVVDLSSDGAHARKGGEADDCTKGL